MHRRPRGPYNASFNSSQSIPVSNQQHEIARQTKLLIDDQSYIHLDKPQPLASGCFTGLDDQDTIYPEDSISVVEFSRGKRPAPRSKKIIVTKVKKPLENAMINTAQRLSLKPSFAGLGIFNNGKSAMPMVAEEANHGQIIVDDAHIDNAAKCDMTKQSKYFSKAMTKEMALEIEDLEIEENESCPPETDFDQLSRHEQQAKLASVSKGLSAFPAPIEHDGGSSLADFTKSLANITLSKAGVTEISRQLPSECHIDDEFDEIHTSSFQPSCSAPISGSGLYQPLGPATTEQQHHYNQQYGGWDNDLIRAIHVSIGPPQRSRPMRHTSLPAEFVCCVDGRQSADKYEFFRVSQTSNHSVGSDNELMSIHSEFDPNKVRLKADIGICQNEVVLSKGEIWKPRKL